MSEPNLRNAKVAFWILIAGVALVFGKAIFYGFITFDDGAYVFLNQSVIRGLSVQSVVSAFTAEVAGNWHPVTMLAYMSVSSTVGPQPWAYHSLNIALHATNTVLLFGLLRTLILRSRESSPSNGGTQLTEAELNGGNAHATLVCGLAAGLFGLHPLRVESVVWISELKDLLSAFFFVLTIRAYLTWIEDRNRKNYLRMAALFAAGLMSKPMLVTLPCVLLLLDYWPLRRIGSTGNLRQLGVLLVEKLPLFGLSVTACLLTLRYQQIGGAVRNLEAFPFLLRLQSAVLAYASYLRKLVWPTDLALYYPYPKSWPVFDVIVAAVLIIALTTTALMAVRRFPAWFVGWFWYLGTLVPVIGLIQVGQQSMADRYTYIPSMGLSLVIAYAGAAVLEHWAIGRPGRQILACASIAILIAFSSLTWKQVARWQSTEAIYRHSLSVTRDNWFMHQSLATLLAHTGRIDEGIEQLHEALRIDPRNAGIWDDLGYLLQLKGDRSEATGALERAVQLDPRCTSARRVLAAIFRQSGEASRAIEHLRECVRISPRDQQALVALALIRATHPDALKRNAIEAITSARTACELSAYQNPDALDALAAAYAEDQQFELALDFARRGMRAAESTGRGKLAESIGKRLALYEMRLPFRDSR